MAIYSYGLYSDGLNSYGLRDPPPLAHEVQPRLLGPVEKWVFIGARACWIGSADRSCLESPPSVTLSGGSNGGWQAASSHRQPLQVVLALSSVGTK